MNPLYICGETVHTCFECTTTMGEASFDPVCQYPALWDRQDAMYKDSNYKEAKWKDIAEILCLTKEDVIQEGHFEGHFCETKNTKSKSRNGLSDHKLKWKYYDIRSFLDVTLLE